MTTVKLADLERGTLLCSKQVVSGKTMYGMVFGNNGTKLVVWFSQYFSCSVVNFDCDFEASVLSTSKEDMKGLMEAFNAFLISTYGE